jgi:hypothetical protein
MPPNYKMVPKGDDFEVVDEATGVGIPRAAFEQAQREGKDPFAFVTSSSSTPYSETEERLRSAGYDAAENKAKLDAALARTGQIPQDISAAGDEMARKSAPVAARGRKAAPRQLVGGDDWDVPPDLVDAGPVADRKPVEMSDAVYKFAAENVEAPPAKPNIEQDAMEWAKQQAAKRAFMADFGRSLSVNADMMAGGKATDKGTWDTLAERADQPVKDAQAKQKAALEYAKAQAEGKKAGEAERHNRAVELTAAGESSRKRDEDKATLQQRADQLKAQMEDHRLSREQKGELARQHAQLMMTLKSFGVDTMNSKREHVLAERAIPTYRFRKGVEPSAAAAKKMQDAMTSKMVIDGGLDAIKMMFKQHGRKVLPDGERARLESETMNIINELRQFNKMGVPNGRDYEMLAKQLSEATGASSYTKFDDHYIQQLKSLRGQLKRKMDATAFASGYEPDEMPSETHGGKSTTAAIGGARQASPNAGKRIRDAKGRTGTWDGVSPLPPGAQVIDG